MFRKFQPPFQRRIQCSAKGRARLSILHLSIAGRDCFPIVLLCAVLTACFVVSIKKSKERWEKESWKESIRYLLLRHYSF